MTEHSRSYPEHAALRQDDPTCYIERSKVREILIGQPDESLYITEEILREVDALPIVTAEDILVPAQSSGDCGDLAQQIKSIADDCREDFNTCPQCGYEDHTAIKNSNLLLLIDSALTGRSSAWQPPIETAPFVEDLSEADPERILVWVDDGGSRGEGAIAFGYAFRGHDGSVRLKADGYMGFKVTLWRPMPAGPAVTSTEGK